MVHSAELLHESACGLQEEDHYINDDFVKVIEAVGDRCEQIGLTFDWGAAGCGGCYHTDADASVFWVAQGDGRSDEALKFDVNDNDLLSREGLGNMIVYVAEKHGVPVSWNGDTRKCVIIGTEGAYRNFDVGTRVKKPHRRGHKTGTVLSPDLLHSTECRYRVYDQSDYDGIGAGGELLARFADEDDAERFARCSLEDDLHIDKQIIRGGRDGDCIVLWDGHERPALVNAKNIEDV